MQRENRNSVSGQMENSGESHSGSAISILGSMKMQVCKSRDNQAVAQIFHGNILIFLWKLGKNSGADAILTDYIGVLHKNHFTLILAVTDRTF